MKQDRRLYERININIKANIYVDNREFPVTINDISECGVLFICEDAALQSLITTGATIKFQSVDRYELFDIVHNDIVIGQGRVVRFDSTNDNMECGVALNKPSSSLIKYVENKKVVKLLKEIN